MFTGIIRTIGQVSCLEKNAVKTLLRVTSSKLDISAIKIGDSIAVNGACLTVIGKQIDELAFEISAETWGKTNFMDLQINHYVNLEQALCFSSRLDGHLVAGHVDAIGELSEITFDGECYQWKIAFPNQLSPYIAPKGSIAIDGVSLTINQVEKNNFWINIISHTRINTNFQYYAVGKTLNLEVDLVARYLRQMIKCETINN